MSSYLSNLLTRTTSSYNTLRRTLLSNEDDGDTEDDSHISRILRAYYTEKARPFPPWLPPDPNDKRAITPQPYAAAQGGGYFASAANKSQYGGPQPQHQPGQRGSLSDLWDAPATPSAAPLQPQSLRAGRRAPTTNSASTLAVPQGGRPLPSQRAGSYQSMQSQHSARPSLEPSLSSNNAAGGTAQERLKARLWGGGRASPGPSQVGSPDPFDQYAAENAAGGMGESGGSGNSRRFGRLG